VIGCILVDLLGAV